MSRFFLELAYNGKNYHGWQIQPNAISVQEVLNDCIGKMLREEINVVGCGRTDTGVHATYFVAHFDCDKKKIDGKQFCHKLNRFLPKDIAVYSLTKVDEEAHSRFSAISRTYEYHLVNNKNPFLQDSAYYLDVPLDFDLMNKAAEILFEYIDFTSFSKLHTDVKTNNCKIMYAKWEQKDGKWIFTIKADRFLRNMVRAIVGTLLEVGRGKMTLEGFRGIIEAGDRGVAGTSAPGHALYLVGVGYEDGIVVG
ncbi:tRNA pseudouridine(38-40) synthase TruA [Plebeiibacterium marinum]|uniref:tRNA pseudouridine synthase A n=1 Tax=Plebeiibacterium marinum TaxID=2992111 RepID=A0AAE3MIF8_9BACT|nr:tRNA pseudouridine(38-40) synthase TruA [Plebeiobacterium marinum]MCW3807677.1 tRNA pseudouridine(38-40) synthase TruA [Plebeiobacterium marinum]